MCRLLVNRSWLTLAYLASDFGTPDARWAKRLIVDIQAELEARLR
jgi:hypothetical protein